jgi:glycosyltransferase involved in cell wall biosynthesis
MDKQASIVTITKDSSPSLRPIPKVLIIGQPFNDETGGGITLSNLFAGWKQDCLAVVCSAYLINENTNMEVCSNYYQLGQEEHKWKFPFSLIKRKYYSGPIRIEKRPGGNKIKKEKAPSNLRKKLIMDYFYPVLTFLGVYNFLSTAYLSPKLCKWLDEYQPDVIYAQATSRYGLLLCNMIHDYLKKPLVFHMMDDWPATLRGEGILGKYWHKKINEEITSLFGRADLLLSISDYMAMEYEKRYDKRSVTFHNPINIEFWKRDRRVDFEIDSNPTILYAGRVGQGIDSSLETIAQAVALVNKELGINMIFSLQTAEIPSWSNKYSCVRHKPFVPYEELPKTFASSDFLILPYDFTDKSINFIGFSMPTKAPEYLASGSPVIVFAPEVTALVQYARKHRCAKVVTENDVEVLKNAIKELVLDKDLRESYSKRAIETVEKNHDATAVKEHFRSLICSLHKV